MPALGGEPLTSGLRSVGDQRQLERAERAYTRARDRLLRTVRATGAPAADVDLLERELLAVDHVITVLGSQLHDQDGPQNALWSLVQAYESQTRMLDRSHGVLVGLERNGS